MNLAEKLKQARSKSGESLQQIADAVGASKAHIWELETGRSQNPSLDLVQRLAAHFQLTVAYLAENTPEDASKAHEFFRKNENKLERMSERDLDILEGLLDRFGKQKPE
jgi:transcriptional regulator with XRE-family HTH domain